LPLEASVKLLRARPTRHFLFLLVQCRCGKRFGQRADRLVVACFDCGRLGSLDKLRPTRAEEAPARRRPAAPASRTPARHVLRATLARRRRRAHRWAALSRALDLWAALRGGHRQGRWGPGRL